VDKKAATPYLIKKKKNGKVIAIKANKQANKGKGGQTHLGAKGNNFNHEKHQEGLDPEREVSGPKVIREIWRLGKVGMYIMGYIISDQVYLPSGLVKTLDPNFPPMTKVTRFAVFLF
jgi:hypothetical protein